MTNATIAGLMREGRRAALAGRSGELRLLRQVTKADGPVVVYVHGPAGIGKTALISALDAWLEEEGVNRLHIAAGAVEPTPTAILAAFGKRLGQDIGTVGELAAALSRVKDPIVVMVDDVDAWRLAAYWLRADLIPALPANARFVLAGAAPRRARGRSSTGSPSSTSDWARSRGPQAMRPSPPPVLRRGFASASGA
jgi:hypothetical protein